MFLFVFSLLFSWDSLTLQMQNTVEQQSDKRFNGTVLIAQDQEKIFEYQANQLPFSAPIFPQTQFVIASVSKQFTAALILKAQDEQKLQLDDPVAKYISPKKYPFLWKITIHHLLNHTSGLKDSLSQGIKYAAGEKFEYQNLNYILLGKILSIIYKKPYNALLNDFFQKAQMKKSFALSHIKTKKNIKKHPDLTWGFLQKDTLVEKRKILNPIDFNPTGGLVSTAEDLIKWNFLLHQDRSFLSDSSYQKMLQGYSVRKYRFGELKYGYGVHISTLEDLEEIFHGGFIQGYISSLFYYPKYKVSLIILENYSGKDAAKNTYIIHDRLRNVLRQFLLIQEQQ